MVAERLIGNAAIDQSLAIDNTNRQLGWNFSTNAEDKEVTRGFVRMPPSGGFVEGSFWQLWKRAAPISASTLLQSIDISGITGASGSWQQVPGVANTALITDDLYFVTVFMPHTDPGVYLFKSGFGNPTSGSLSGNCIFKNTDSSTVDPDTIAPDDETFTGGAFAVDIEIDDVGGLPVAGGWLPKVGRHCVYLLQVTVGGNTKYVKRRPAIITAVAGSTVDLRVGHSGEVYTGISQRTDPNSDSAGTYVSY